MVLNGRALKNMRKYKMEMVLEVHPYDITELAGKRRRCQTYVKDGDSRRLICSADKDGLFEKLYDFYFVHNGTSSMTMDKLFQEWLVYKEAVTDSLKTIRRHEQHWNKYFAHLKSKKVASYDRLELQKECNQLVKTNNLSSREWQNIKTILSGMFYYASEKHYIQDDIMRDVKITVKFRQVNKKIGKTETFLTDELDALIRYLNAEFARTHDMAILAVRFNFFVGCRVGELVALKWCDFLDIQHLHVCREEIKESVHDGDKWKDVYTVVEHTKTHTDRIIPLMPGAIRILNDIRLKMAPGSSDDDFIFMRDGSRITSRQINYVLEKACKKIGIPVKRSHKIRKTVASRLSAGNVPLDSIREMLGHSNLSTTLGYIYNPLSEKETYALMSKAL